MSRNIYFLTCSVVVVLCLFSGINSIDRHRYRQQITKPYENEFFHIKSSVYRNIREIGSLQDSFPLMQRMTLMDGFVEESFKWEIALEEYRTCILIEKCMKEENTLKNINGLLYTLILCRCIKLLRSIVFGS